LAGKTGVKNLSIGKIRGLEQITNRDGIFIICAMDHRGSLRRMVNPDRPELVGYETMVERKLELCSALSPYASAVLLDPNFGAAQCISQGLIPGSTGLMVSVEATGYSGGKGRRLTELQEKWSVEKIKRMGASAVKMLLYYRPDLEKLAARQRKTVERVAEECLKQDLPFLVEPMSYPVDEDDMNSEGFRGHRPSLIIETARQLTVLSMDVLKAEFPGDLDGERDEGELLEQCRRLDAASRVPWVILSAGVNYETFRRQVEIACRAGASGFLGGRAIWQEAMKFDNAADRMSYLSTTAVDRLKNLIEIATKYATPWYGKFGDSISELADISEKWFEEY
jgi:tagatose 1,6-diphosphate aldolase